MRLRRIVFPTETRFGASKPTQEEWTTATASTVAALGGGGQAAGAGAAGAEGGMVPAPRGGAVLPPSFQAAQAALKRKYRHLRRALGKDGMLFADEIFEIRPLEGEIWAQSEIEVTVFFRPRTTTEYASSAFLDCIGREERLPLRLGGGGIGPKVCTPPLNHHSPRLTPENVTKLETGDNETFFNLKLRYCSFA